MAKTGIAGLAALGLLAVSVPATAQFSTGYKFLEAIRKKDGNTAQEMMEVPGSGATIVNTRDISTGETALHIVTGRRDLPWMGVLILRGANVNARNGRGVTPLQLAVSVGFTEGAELLIEKGARTEEPDAAGETPLITAVHRRDTGIMRILLKAGANPDRADNSGRSARDYATLEGRSSPLLAEIEANAKPNGSAAGAPRGKYGPSF
jgi:ankyrin repeat protein